MVPAVGAASPSSASGWPRGENAAVMGRRTSGHGEGSVGMGRGLRS